MNRKIKTSLFIGVLGIALAGAWVYEKPTITKPSQTTHQGLPKQLPSPIPTGSGNIQNPSTWSTYSFNNQFTLAYPPTWIVLPDREGNGFDVQTPYFHQDDDFTMPYGNSTDVSFSSFGQDDLSDMSYKNGDQFSSDSTGEKNIITNLVHLHIDNYPAIEFDYYPTDNTHFIKTRMAIQKGKTLYRFEATYADPSGKQLFEEIMKSITFI